MGSGSWQLVSKIGDEHQKTIPPAVVFVLLLALIGADYVVFRQFGHNYFRWYLARGPVIALAISLVSIAVELDRDPTLISLNPSGFAAGWLAAAGETFRFLGTLGRDSESRGVDPMLTGLFGLVLVALWTAWLVVVAPLQYFVNVIAGAPARTAVASKRRTWIRRTGKAIELRTGPLSEMPVDAEEIGLARRPVAVTGTIAAGLVFALSLAISANA